MKSPRKPWMKFYPQDWLGDPGLRFCSVAARGVWIDMIALAHEATPYGHVLINGKSPTISDLAKITGTSESECQTYVEELESRGVFNRTRKGVIFSRRMIRDEKKARDGRNSVNKRYQQDTENKEKKAPPKRPPTTTPNRPPTTPEARGQSPEVNEREGEILQPRATPLSPTPAFLKRDLPATTPEQMRNDIIRRCQGLKYRPREAVPGIIDALLAEGVDATDLGKLAANLSLVPMRWEDFLEQVQDLRKQAGVTVTGKQTLNDAFEEMREEAARRESAT